MKTESRVDILGYSGWSAQISLVAYIEKVITW